jgi:rare lipoprotein A
MRRITDIPARRYARPGALLAGWLVIVLCFTGCSSRHVFERQDGAPRDPPPNLSRVHDAVPKPEPRSRYGNPRSYVVFGERYYTLPTSKGYHQRGLASWYGTKFHGMRTSSGEPYDLYGMTAAHKTLPLPTYVEVTNLENGRSVIVRVNDRGPFHSNRIIDLSYAAAYKLGMLGKGTARVDVRAIDPLAPDHVPDHKPVLVQVDSASRKPADAQLFLQAGAFRNETNALRLQKKIQGGNLGSVHVVKASTQRGVFYKVQVGPLAGTTEANRIAQSLRTLGINEARTLTKHPAAVAKPRRHAENADTPADRHNSQGNHAQ